MNHLTNAAIAALAIAIAPTVALSQILNLSHQWSTSDVRHEVAEIFATELAGANVGLDVTIHEKGNLYAAREQYAPLKAGDLDFMIYPLAYSGGKRPPYSLTLMPGLVQNHDHALRLTESEFMDDIESMSSFKIYEAMESGTLQVACFTPAGDYALWFMYMPLLMNKATFDDMSPEQQIAVTEAGQAAQDYYFAEAAAQDSMARDVFQEKGVEIKEMSFDDYIAWFGVAKLTSYEAFLEDMPDGLALLDKALNVE